MQLYALDGHLPLSASGAEKGKSYTCPECGSLVRLRGGPSRQTHFYHLRVSKYCRQNQKSLEHLHLQLKLLDLLGEGEGQIECPFEGIGRIADVAWHTQKIVFEVQCSPISLKEVEERIFDYQRAGYTILWILHDKQFNKNQLSASEHLLRKNPCYYTNIDKMGEGVVYDQFEVLRDYRRVFKGPPLSVNPIEISLIPKITPPDKLFPKIILERLSTWKWFAKGDLLHRLLKEGNFSSAAKKMADLESFHSRGKISAKRLPLGALLAKIYLFLLDNSLGNKPR